MQSEKIDSLLEKQFLDYVAEKKNFSKVVKQNYTYLNQNTVHYNKESNELYIYHIGSTLESMKFYITSIDMTFAQKISSENTNIQDHFKDLMENFTKTKEIRFLSRENEDLIDEIEKPDIDYAFLIKKLSDEFGIKENVDQLPLNFYPNSEFKIFIIFSERTAYICRYDSHNILVAKEIYIKSKSKKIIQIKWHPDLAKHIAILSDDYFCVLNLSDNEGRKNPEFELSLKSKTNDYICEAVDFSFFSKSSFEDFRLFTVLFMDSKGNFYYYAPVFLSGLTFTEEEWRKLKRITEESFQDDSFDLKYLNKMFERIENEKEQESNTIILSKVILDDERVTRKNVIQGPLIRIDGKRDKKDRNNQKNLGYSNFFILPNTRSLVIIAIKKSGRVVILFSLDSFYPSFKLEHRKSTHQAKSVDFNLLVVSRNTIPDFMSKTTEDLSIDKKIVEEYKYIRDNSKIKLSAYSGLEISKDIISTQAVLQFYQNVYLIKMSWIDEVENHLRNNTWFTKELTREDMHTELELLVCNSLEEDFNLSEFNPYKFGYYGLTIIKNYILIFKSSEKKISALVSKIFSEQSDVSIETKKAIMRAEQAKLFSNYRGDFGLRVNSSIAVKIAQIEALALELGDKSVEKSSTSLEEITKEAKLMGRDILNEFAKDAARLKELEKLFTEKKKQYEELETKDIQTEKGKINKRVQEILKNMMDHKKRISDIVTLIKRHDYVPEKEDLLAKERLDNLKAEVKTKSEQINELKKKILENILKRKQAQAQNLQLPHELSQKYRDEFNNLKSSIIDVNEKLDKLIQLAEKSDLQKELPSNFKILNPNIVKKNL